MTRPVIAVSGCIAGEAVRFVRDGAIPRTLVR